MTKQLVGLLIVFVMFTLASGVVADRTRLEVKRGREEHINDTGSVNKVTLYKADNNCQKQIKGDELFQICSPNEMKQGCEPKNSSMFFSRIMDNVVILTALAACEPGCYFLNIYGDHVIKKAVSVNGSWEPPEASALKEDSLENTGRTTAGITESTTAGTTESTTMGTTVLIVVSILAPLAFLCIICYKKWKRYLQESLDSGDSAEDQENIHLNTINDADEQIADSCKMVNEKQAFLGPEDLDHPETISGLRKEDQKDPDRASDSCPEAMENDDDCSDVGYNSYNDDSSFNCDGDSNYADDDEKCDGSVNGDYTNHDYNKSKNIYTNSNDDNITVDDGRNNYYNDVNGDNNGKNNIDNDKTCVVDGPDNVNDDNSATVIVVNDC